MKLPIERAADKMPHTRLIPLFEANGSKANVNAILNTNATIHPIGKIKRAIHQGRYSNAVIVNTIAAIIGVLLV